MAVTVTVHDCGRLSVPFLRVAYAHDIKVCNRTALVLVALGVGAPDGAEEGLEGFGGSENVDCFA